MTTQLTREEAIAIHEGEDWRNWTDDYIVEFQLFQDRLCVPFDRFHEAIEAVLVRPVWTHEFAGDHLQAEYLGIRKAPTMQDIVDMIPEDKRVIVEVQP